MRRLGLLAIIALAGCMETPAQSDSPLLFADGQFVNADFTSGPFVQQAGSRGQGKFSYTYRAATNSFGALRVISHTPGALVVAGETTTCAFNADRTIRCENGGAGTWFLS